MAVVRTSNQEVRGAAGVVEDELVIQSSTSKPCTISDEVVGLLFASSFSIRSDVFLLTYYSTPERLPGSFEEELALRTIAERLRLRRIKYAKILASKLKIADDTDIVSEADTISTVHTASGMPSANAPSRLQVDDNQKDLTQPGASINVDVNGPPVRIERYIMQSHSD
jgi:hypothetical protein